MICTTPGCTVHYGCQLRAKGVQVAAGGIRTDHIVRTTRGPDGSEKHTYKRHEDTGTVGGVEMTRPSGRVDVTVTPPPVAVKFGSKEQ